MHRIEMEIYEYWLGRVERLGNTTKRMLIDYTGNAKEVFRLSESEIYKLLPKYKAEKMITSRKKDIDREYEEFCKGDIRYYSIAHPAYPNRLKEIDDAPFGIYLLGNLPEEDKPTVAVIGARQCSEYGRYMAEICGKELAFAGMNVVSGMARGIDGISQSSALQMGGSVYGVLGCGVDVCYPAENRYIYEQIKKQGGILSEYMPGTKPRPQLFPPRNRIISGLADVVLIIEAREKSGTLITADMALEQGRDVYVVPGRVTDGLSEGCNRLIKQGAGIMLSISEMLEETRLCIPRKKNVETGYSEAKDKKINQSCMWDFLDFYPKDIEEIRKEAGMEYRETIHELMKLCIEGKAEQVSPGKFVKKHSEIR